jgi:hypothetical protein
LLHWDALLRLAWYTAWTYAAAICTGISGLLYVRDGMKQLASHPTSSATTIPPGRDQ